MTNHPNRSTERVTIQTGYDQAERIALPTPHWTGKREIQTGVTLEALYRGPRTGRMFARSYSIWDDGHGRNTGTIYRELDMSEYLRLCDKADIEPVNVTPIEV
jgi:hypothetical protein